MNDGAAQPVVLRRPSDLAAEPGPQRSRASRPDPLAWPEGFVATEADRRALVVLLGLAALTPRRLLELADERGSAAACLGAVLAGKAGSDGDRTWAAATDPDEVLRRTEACGARLIAPGDAEYPESLVDLFDPPAGLFVRGSPLLADRAAVAVVGARGCSPAGREMAEAIGASLARAGAIVVSGAALGIDGEAHRGALRAGGPTVAVLGCGIDLAYPPRHRSLLDEIAAAGTIVSEYPPGIRAEPFRFPARNRLVAALSAAVVVVEGAEGSGSMITADHALELGREVFAVPGAVTNPLTAVPLSLIRDGARLMRGPDDLLDDLGLQGGPVEPAAVSESLPPQEARVWNAIVGPSLPDQVARQCGRPLAEVVGTLVSLELRGLVRQVGGRYERRLSQSR